MFRFMPAHEVVCFQHTWRRQDRIALLSPSIPFFFVSFYPFFLLPFHSFFSKQETSSTRGWVSFKSFPPSIHLYHHRGSLATLPSAMLDVFGSVFGRSKKESKTVQQQNEGQRQPSPSTSRRNGGSEEAEGFTVLNPTQPQSVMLPTQPQSVMYPMILTDEVSG